jgi:hypothetical protein
MHSLIPWPRWAVTTVLMSILALAISVVALAFYDDRPAEGASPVLVAAGDIADNSHANLGDNNTAKLIHTRYPNAEVATLGDNVYEQGTLSQFNTYYHDSNPDTAYSWGASLNDRVHPSPGNREYDTAGAQGYIDYFTAKGVQIGPTDKLNYAYTLGNWRILALNSNIEMASGSPQYTFVKNALQNAKAAGQNTILYFHHPLLSSGYDHGWRKSTSTNHLPCSATSEPNVRPLWNLAYNNGGDLILAGHTHGFERFTRVNPNGSATSAGIPSFISGTGGKSLSEFGDRYPDDWNGDCGNAKPQSRYQYNSQHGVLALSLYADGLGWKHVTVDGTVRASGTIRTR